MAGKYFEELPVGTTFTHQPSRTVTETDNLLMTTLTMNTQPLHLDAELSAAILHHQHAGGAREVERGPQLVAELAGRTRKVDVVSCCHRLARAVPSLRRRSQRYDPKA